QLFLLEIAEEEELVFLNRSPEPEACVPVGEGARIELLPSGLRSHHALVAKLAVDAAAELIGPAAGDGIDAGSGEVPLANVIGRDVDLDLLDGGEGDRRYAGSVAGRVAQAK